MPAVNEILNFLFAVAPERYKMEGDNVGLMCGHADGKVTKILVALDATLNVAEEAKALGCELVVTHHPLIYGGTNTVSDATVVGKRILTYLENGLAVISMHTNLDCAPGGVNDVLAERLGLEDIRIMPNVADAPYLIRYGEVEEQSLADFVPFVAQKLACAGLRYVDGGKQVHRVAVGGGSCGDLLTPVKEVLGCDTFVTADVKYHQFTDAKELGLNLIDAGHFETENPVCTYLVTRLRAAYPEVEVVKSKTHADCINFA